MNIPSGTTFAYLTVIKEIERSGHNRRFMCRCVCGNEAIKFLNNLRLGRATSCGCQTNHLEATSAGRAASVAARRERAQLTTDGRICHKCQTWKTWDHFRIDKRCPEGRSSNCIECGRWHGMQQYYGLTRSEWEQMRDSQGSRCALCGDLICDSDLVVDHDHACCYPGSRGKSGRGGCKSCIRGLLCNFCNHLLGRIEKKPALANRFADYLTSRPLLKGD